MTLKEQIIKYLLEDAFASLIVKASVAQAGGGTDYEVAERHAQGVINDHPNETNIGTLEGLALSSIFFIDFGKVDECVGSSY